MPWYSGEIHCTVWFGFVQKRKCFFIEPHSDDGFFDRGHLYGSDDDVDRSAFFSKAALEFLLNSGKRPDIIHCHDWQTALVPVLLFEVYQKNGMEHQRVCFTAHTMDRSSSATSTSTSALREMFMLRHVDKPIVAYIGRRDGQKGAHLIHHAIFYALAEGTQFVLLGSSPDPEINAHFWHQEHYLNNHPDVHLELQFSHELAHLVLRGVGRRSHPVIATRFGFVLIDRRVDGQESAFS